MTKQQRDQEPVGQQAESEVPSSLPQSNSPSPSVRPLRVRRPPVWIKDYVPK